MTRKSKNLKKKFVDTDHKESKDGKEHKKQGTSTPSVSPLPQTSSEKTILDSTSIIESSAKSPRRLLVSGSAGTGKTTYSQHFAQAWAQQRELFTHQFDYFFLIPLPKLLAECSRGGSVQAQLAAFIYIQIAASLTDKVSQQDIETVLSEGGNNRTFLVLDGYHEVAAQLDDPSLPFYRMLNFLLGFRNICLITRSQIPPPQYPFDSLSHIVGFNEANISAFIQRLYKFLSAEPDEGKEKKTAHSPDSLMALTTPAQFLEAALKQNPRFLELAAIPRYLALICESTPITAVVSPDKDHKTTLAPTSALPKLNLATLHQNILAHSLKCNAQNHTSSTPTTWESLSQYYAPQLLSLGAIAWESMQTPSRTIDGPMLRKALQLDISRDVKRSKNLTQRFEDVLALGFLRYNPGEETTPVLKRHYSFVPASFQYYFAAHYLLQTLQGQLGEKPRQAMYTWLAAHKYQPRYIELLSFCAGLASHPDYGSQALRAFWQALLSPPHDTVGKLHLQLMICCLMEARFDSRIPGRPQLLAEIKQWMDSLLKLAHRRSLPKTLAKTAWLGSVLRNEPGLLLNCGWQPPEAWVRLPKNWKAAIDDPNDGIHTIAMLGKLGANLADYPAAITLLFNCLSQLSDTNRIHQAAKSALSQFKVNLIFYPKAFAIVLKAANSPIDAVVTAALLALEGSISSHPQALQVVFEAIKHKSESVVITALAVLGRSGVNLATYPEVCDRLFKLVSDQLHSRDICAAAISAFSASIASSPNILQKILSLTRQSHKYRDVILKAMLSLLGQLGPNLALHPQALDKVFKYAGAYAPAVRVLALSALANIIISNPLALNRMLEAAGDRDDEEVRTLAQIILRKWAARLVSHPETLEVVYEAAANENAKIRTTAISLLGDLGIHLTSFPTALRLVSNGIEDNEAEVRAAAVSALSASLLTHPKLLDVVLNTAKKDFSVRVRRAAVTALGGLEANLLLNNEVLSVVLKASLDRDVSIRQAAFITLGRAAAGLSKHPYVIDTIVFHATDSCAQAEAVAALCAMGAALALHPKALAAVLAQHNDPTTPILLDTPTLIQIYLTVESQSKSQMFFGKPKNPCLPLLLARIEQEDAAIVLGHNTLYFVSGSQQVEFPLSSCELAHPLITAIGEKRQGEGQPRVLFSSCTGKTFHYSVKLPAFSGTAQLPELHIPAPKKGQPTLSALNTIGHFKSTTTPASHTVTTTEEDKQFNRRNS